MAYFKKAKKKEDVFCIIFGLGSVLEVYEESHFKLMVTFQDGSQIPYTKAGVSGLYDFKEQTLFYKDDIDLTNFDCSATRKILSEEKIIKYKEKKRLEVRLPSGIWSASHSGAKQYIKAMLEAQHYHLFRKRKKED